MSPPLWKVLPRESFSSGQAWKFSPISSADFKSLKNKTSRFIRRGLLFDIMFLFIFVSLFIFETEVLYD